MHRQATLIDKPHAYKWQRKQRTHRMPPEYMPYGSYGWLWVLAGLILTFGAAGWMMMP
jgi:hypothetical protein